MDRGDRMGRAWIALMAAFTMAGLASAEGPSAFRIAGEDEAALRAAGVTVHGRPGFVPGRTGRAVRLGANGCLSFPTAGRLDARRGTLSLRVRPDWDGGDGKDHAFVHAGSGQAHFTLFKTAGGTLRFVYKASPSHHTAANVPVRSWKRGEWHAVEAGWLAVGEGVFLTLRVDGTSAMGGPGRLLQPLPDVMFVGRRGMAAQPAEAAIDELTISDRAPALPYATGPKAPVTATVNASRRRPLRRVHDFTTFWNSRENPLPFGADDPEFRRFQDAGFRMVRLVAFSESWLWGTRVGRGDDGGLTTDFADFDRILDLFAAAGAEPYIRLAYHTPSALMGPSADRRNRYLPPKDLAMWDELMRRIVQHVRVQRKLPVRYWVTALNEGDVPVRRGLATAEQISPTINRLYERTTRIVRSIDPNARVGGPALAWTVEPDGTPTPMFASFLDSCRRRDLPLDFVCFHAYGRTHPRDFETATAAIRAEVERRLPKRAAKMEYFLDEWNLWRRDASQDNEYAAAYLAAALHYQRRAGLTKSSIVSFNHFLHAERPARELVRRRGPFDKTAGQAARFRAGRFTADGTTRAGILAHPPTPSPGHPARPQTFGRFEVAVPRQGRPRLAFATGLGIQPHPGMDGVSFGIVVRDGEREDEVFRTHQRRPAWEAHEVRLDRYAGRTVQVELRTWSGPVGSNTVADWGVWGEPRLLAGPADQPETVFDFVQQVAAARTGVRMPGYGFRYDDETIARYLGLPLIKGPVVTTPWFVWRMHSRLGPQELAVDLPGRDGILDDDSGGLTATAAPDRLALLLWHFDLLRPAPRKWTIHLADLPRPLRDCRQLRVTEYRVDRDHNNPYTRYVRNGADSRQGRYNLDTAALEPTRSRLVDRQDTVPLAVELPNRSVCLIEVTAPDEPRAPSPAADRPQARAASDER